MDSKIKVIVADDMEIIANNMKKIIEKNPRVENVEISLDVQDEIIKIMNIEPDLVFTDMQMPKRIGLDVIEEIQSYPTVRKKPRFVLVTANRDSELVIKSRELGFFLEYKPIKEENINKYIDEFEPILIDEKEEKRREKKDAREYKKEMKKHFFLRKILGKTKKNK